MKTWMRIAIFSIVGAGIIALGVLFFTTRVMGYMYGSLMLVGLFNLANGIMLMFSDERYRTVALILTVGGGILLLFMGYALLFT